MTVNPRISRSYSISALRDRSRPTDDPVLKEGQELIANTDKLMKNWSKYDWDGEGVSGMDNDPREGFIEHRDPGQLAQLGADGSKAYSSRALDLELDEEKNPVSFLDRSNTRIYAPSYSANVETYTTFEISGTGQARYSQDINAGYRNTQVVLDPTNDTATVIVAGPGYKNLAVL